MHDLDGRHDATARRASGTNRSVPAAEASNHQAEHGASGSKRDSEGKREHGDAGDLIHGRQLL
jgi:hypothetical protein